MTRPPTSCRSSSPRSVPGLRDAHEREGNAYCGTKTLHGNSAVGHTDPRLNLVIERGSDPLLRIGGETLDCASEWNGDRIYDMVGNLDEWPLRTSGQSPSTRAPIVSHSTGRTDPSTPATPSRNRKLLWSARSLSVPSPKKPS